MSASSGRPRAGGGEVRYRGIRWRQAEPGRLYWYNEGYGRWVRWSPGQDAPPLPPAWVPAEAVAGSDARGGDGVAQVAARRSPAPSDASKVGATAPTTRMPTGRAGLAGGSPAGAGASFDHREGGSGHPRERPGLLRYLPDDAMARRRSMTSPYRWVPILIVLAIVVLAVYQATRSPARATHQEIAAAQALKGKCLAHEAGHPETYSTVPVGCGASAAAVKVVAVVFAGEQASCPRGSLYAQVAKPGVVGEPFECLQLLHKGG